MPHRRLASGLLVALLATGCGSSAGAPTAGPAAPSPSRSGPASVTIAVNQTLSDSVLGDTVRVLRVVRGFPVPATLPAIAGKELVLVEVRAEAGKKYDAGIQGSSFSVLEPGSDIPDAESSALVRSEMAAAGYPPFPSGGVAAGKKGAGWLAFQLEEQGATKLRLQLTRAAAKVSGTSQTIPRKAFTVPLPDRT